MAKLVLVRHGKSEWNKQNRFTGWVDVDLAPEGIEEAKKAGEKLKKAGFAFDVCFSSYLKRAIKTGIIILEELDLLWIDHLKDWRFNERHYGALTGLNKDEVKKEVGEEKFLLYRRSYDVPPPPLSEDDKRHPRFDPKYKSFPIELLPNNESLKEIIIEMKLHEKVHYDFFEKEKEILGFSEAAYALLNAHNIEIIEHDDFNAFAHKAQMRLCYNAQEEIFDITYKQVKELKKAGVKAADNFLPPCSIRAAQNIKPICPEGERFCGVKVWKLNFDEYKRLI